MFTKSQGFHWDASISLPSSKITGPVGGTKVQIVINVINYGAEMINLSEMEEPTLTSQDAQPCLQRGSAGSFELCKLIDSFNVA